MYTVSYSLNVFLWAILNEFFNNDQHKSLGVDSPFRLRQRRDKPTALNKPEQ